MNQFAIFIEDFIKRSGLRLLSVAIFEKLSGFIISFLLIVYLEKEVLGELSYVQSVLAFFSAFLGLGTNSGLLLIGSHLKSNKNRQDLLNYSFSYGTLSTVLFTILFILIIYFLDLSDLLFFLFATLSIRMIVLYFTELQSAWFKTNLENKLLSNFDWIKNIGLLLFGLILIPNYQENGFIVSIIFIPLIVFIFFKQKLSLNWDFTWKIQNFTSKFYWKFSLVSGFSALIAQLIFITDSIMIFHMLGSESNAEYRVASIIPINLLFLPVVFMKTDYVTIAKNSINRSFLINYYKNYFYLFLIISFLILLISTFFGEEILSMFGKQYANSFSIFFILMIASCLSLLLRVPLGNIISALGKSNINLISALLTFLLDIILNYFFIQRYGLIGASYATAIALLFSGLINFTYFTHYLSRLTKS
ncbi:MAG: polysaccharide biosynthesis C-terminal domain-containing protein [Flavobacteriales bacterium]|nr:polysaccharide biosynthesis C-terminal domain-containing protein [Flavobacteriales bacterium]